MTNPSKSYGTLTIYRPISSTNQDGTMELRSSATSSLELVFNSTSLCRRVWKPRHLTAWGGFPVGFTNSARGQSCAILSLTAGEHFDRVQWKHTFGAETNKQRLTSKTPESSIGGSFEGWECVTASRARKTNAVDLVSSPNVCLSSSSLEIS